MQIRVKTFRIYSACKSGLRLSVFSSHQRTQHAGDVVGSQAWVDGRTKTNVTPKNVHTLFFLVVGEEIEKMVTITLVAHKAHYLPCATCLLPNLLQ